MYIVASNYLLLYLSMKEGGGVFLLTCWITYFIYEINEAEVPPSSDISSYVS